MTPMRRNRRLSPRETIPIMYNVRVRTLHKGRVVEQHKGHNIFLNVGRDWLIQAISCASYPVTVGSPPPAAASDRRIAFMGVGVGGREQSDPANQAWVIAHVDGAATFLQDDTDATATGLEVPVLWAAATYGKPIQSVAYSAPVGPAPGYTVWVKYTALWGVGEINDQYGGDDVPITEAAMYPYLLTGADVKEFLLADMKTVSSSYENFRPVTKQSAFELEIQWTYRV
jgi:hypothetical protein